MVTMAQTKIEGINYDSRKNVLKYDDVIRRQRETFYSQRQEVVKAEHLDVVIDKIFKIAVENKVEEFMENPEKFDDEKLTKLFNERLIGENIIDVNKVKEYDDDQDIINYIYGESSKLFKDRMDKLKEDMKNVIPDEVLKENPNFIEQNEMMFIKRVILPILDKNWREHIDDMDGFRQGIYLQSYAQKNPLELYQREGYNKFERLNKKMNEEIFITAMHARVRVQRQQEEVKDETKELNTNQDLSRVRQQGPVNNQNNPFANVGPNDPCPCGSGKKFKFCHGIRR